MEQISIVNKKISELKLNDNTLETLKNNKINTLMKLSQQSRKDLIILGLSPDETKQLQIKLQLQVLDLK